MIEVPLHIGHAKVFDLSAESVFEAHRVRFTGSQNSLRNSQILYSEALKTLRKCLEDPEQARSAQTLCATVLLSMYEVRLCNIFGAGLTYLVGNHWHRGECLDLNTLAAQSLDQSQEAK